MSNSALSFKARHVPGIASFTVILIGCLALVGWVVDSTTLKSVLPGLRPMMPSAAMSLILGGAALWMLSAPASSRIRAGIGRVFAFLVALIALGTLVERPLGLNAVIDSFPFRLEADLRMAVSTAVSLVLCGAALLMLNVETRRGARPAEFLALTAIVIAMLTLLGYSYGVVALYRITPSMAIHSAVALLLLAGGILSVRPDRGLMAVATSASAGGFMLRRLILAVIGVPSLLGWLNVAGTEAGLYGREFGMALLVAANMVVFMVVIWRNAQLLHVTDVDRQKAQTALVKSYDELESRVEERTADLTAVNEALTKEITERKRAEEERDQLLAREQAARSDAQEAVEIVRRLQTLTDSALTHLALEDLLGEMLHRIRQLLSADAAAILLVTEDGQYLTGRAAIGLEEEARVRVPMGRGVAGRIAVSSAPMVVEDLSTVEVVSSILRESAKSLIGVPLMIEERVIGVIHVDTMEFRSFTQDDLKLLQLAADRVAVAIEHSRLYEAEQQARLEAEAANRMKDEFLATVSHELRSPLNSILGWITLLREGNLDPEAAARAMETVERSARAQNRIIGDLLDVSRIISGQLRLNVRTLEPARIVETAVEAVRPAADAKSVRLQVLLDPDAGPIAGDSDRLQQIVWNLVSNAIKFTPKGGSAQVRLERVASHVEITVSDTGEGISPEFLPFIFDRFRQADSSSTRKQGGLGLGLAIVRHLVELHGGTVHAESEGDGSGSTFVVKLPLMISREGLPAEERTHPAAALDKITLECPPQLIGLRVLVVDDEAAARELVTAILAECEADVKTAASAAEALSILKDGSDWLPEVLISDIEMTELDGYELMRRVRALPAERGGRVPAVALTAYARVEDRMKALAAGFQMHVPKPVEPTELLTVLASVTGRLAKNTGPLSLP